MAREVTINLRGVARAAAGFALWPTRKAASVQLAKLRADGLNVERDLLRFHPAVANLTAGWVIARPDELAEMCWLMAADGRWARGRLVENYETGVWQHLPPPGGGLLPATFTHVTRTAPYHDRTQRYRTKSNGSCGRYVWSQETWSICTCGWSALGANPDEARWRGRQHRENPTPAIAPVTALAATTHGGATHG
ncbi:hypothetical protein [Actinoplanes sp. URMC 104]|uniref:hypothetical protein n=1 Tax=Actinoplanes sp. URMC 104 TaxID=3423409 RepID=UPI003F1A5C34